MALHMTYCPHCCEHITIHCDNVPNPFQEIKAEYITRLIDPAKQYPPIKPIPPEYATQLQLMFLFHLLGHDLPELEYLPQLPDDVSHFLDNANKKQAEAMLIQLVGVWDTFQNTSSCNVAAKEAL